MLYACHSPFSHAQIEHEVPECTKSPIESNNLKGSMIYRDCDYQYSIAPLNGSVIHSYVPVTFQEPKPKASISSKAWKGEKQIMGCKQKWSLCTEN